MKELTYTCEEIKNDVVEAEYDEYDAEDIWDNERCTAYELQEMFKDDICDCEFNESDISIGEIFDLACNGFIRYEGISACGKFQNPADVEAFYFEDADKVGTYLYVKEMLSGLDVWHKVPHIARVFAPTLEMLNDYVLNGVAKGNVVDFINNHTFGPPVDTVEVTAGAIKQINDICKLVAISLALIYMFESGWATKENYTACIQYLQKYILNLPNGNEILNRKKLMYEAQHRENLWSPSSGTERTPSRNEQNLIEAMKKSDLVRAYCEFATLFGSYGSIIESKVLQRLSKIAGFRLKNLTASDIHKVGYAPCKELKIFG